jgi:TonB-dependent starch-binding outer membrane protein SusC
VRNTAITRMTEGYPVGHFVGYQTQGIFQSQNEVFSHINNQGDLLQPNAKPGDLRFIDTNGDGTINSDDIANIGNPWPKHIIGLTTNINYKGIYLSAIFNTQIGHDIYRTYERSDVTYTNYQSFWLDRWTPENPGNDMPRLTTSDPNNNQRPSDFYVEDGTFLRMRNLQIGYDLPTNLIGKLKMQEMRIYFTANNLFTLTKYRGFDPDIGTSGWILDTGIDKGFYPHNQSFGGGVKVTF